jgi:hypothetical protein
MEFLSRAQLITALGAVLLALVVLDLVRRRRLAEEYSVLWVVASVVVAILGFSTPLLKAVTHALGILYEASTVFFFGLVFATAMLLFLSVKLSRLTQEHAAMVREMAFLREELERARGTAGSTGGGESV